MADRLWIPTAYVVDTCPPGRASPDAWIGAPSGDVWLFATDEDFDFGLILAPDQVAAFVWVERLDPIRVEIRDDGSHVALDPVPDGVTHFTFGTDLLADSLDEFVGEWRALGLDLDDDRTVLVDMARWSPQAEPFRFVVTAHGPRFMRETPAEGACP